jgi:hypothetical protein
MAARNTDNLTGVWQGLYTYPSGLHAVLFNATLIETATALTGSTFEVCPEGQYRGEELFATLLGQRTGNAVSFVKTYETLVPGYSAVNYEGALSADTCEIEGVWIIAATWSGRFLMIRSGAVDIEERRAAFERA